MLDTKTHLNLTPECSRKRKRHVDKLDLETGFTNAAFSSTPKKLMARRRKSLVQQNLTPFVGNACLEVKSITDIVKKNKVTDVDTIAVNPYEVVRKPPKKKRQTDNHVEAACFENPALNLEVPEKQFNPFEVIREADKLKDHSNKQGFVNSALNLKTQDGSAYCNPFEIPRSSTAVEDAPTRLTLGLPFIPTVGCRIDFQNLPLMELTPSKLLAEKLVFSPVLTDGPKRSVGSLNEESTMDIGKELDRYQLELENSINEAKMRKNNANKGDDSVPLNVRSTLEVATEQKITFTQKLQGIEEAEENEEETEIRNEVEHLEIDNVEEQKMEFLETFEYKHQMEFKSILETVEATKMCTPIVTHNEPENEYDDDFADEEDEVDFQIPTPFVRSYRPAGTFNAVSKESLNSNKSDDNKPSEENKKSQHSVKNIIRNSIRKIMHPTHKTEGCKDFTEKLDKEPQHHSNIISSIRHSLRRKPTKQLLIEDEDDTLSVKSADISIVDSSERTMKLKSFEPQIEFAKIEQLTNEKKHSLRNSIRRSTREVMRSVFHKQHEHYNFGK